MLKLKLKKLTQNFEKKNKYWQFTYSGTDFILEKFALLNRSRLLLTPGSCKLIKPKIVASPVHFEYANENQISSQRFDDFSKLDTNRIKIFLYSGKNTSVYINQAGTHQKIVAPEDTINGIHFVHHVNLCDFIKYYRDYKEKNLYQI